MRWIPEVHALVRQASRARHRLGSMTVRNHRHLWPARCIVHDWNERRMKGVNRRTLYSRRGKHPIQPVPTKYLFPPVSRVAGRTRIHVNTPVRRSGSPCPWFGPGRGPRCFPKLPASWYNRRFGPNCTPVVQGTRRVWPPMSRQTSYGLVGMSLTALSKHRVSSNRVSSSLMRKSVKGESSQAHRGPSSWASSVAARNGR